MEVVSCTGWRRNLLQCVLVLIVGGCLAHVCEAFLCGWEKAAGSLRSEIWVLREAILEDTLLSALSEILTWSRKTPYSSSWLVSPAPSCTCSYSYGNGPATRLQTGDKGWLFVESLWKTITPPHATMVVQRRGRTVGCECEPLWRFAVTSPMAQR